tara:strand:+ start:975 stop:1844 length:870 start_codon:yes stop_codon:yes gene_type:complete
MAAIKNFHQNERVILLTRRQFLEFAEASGSVDAVWIDPRPGFVDFRKWLALRRCFRGAGFERVYDLQTSQRTSLYHNLFFPDKPPEWSGIARGCSHPHDNAKRDSMHTVERQSEQLICAGVKMRGYEDPSKLDFSWATSDISTFGLPRRYVLFVPGGSQHRPAKRWPEENYNSLAAKVLAWNKTPVLLGGIHETALTARIAAAVPGTIDLAGKTNLLQLAEISRRAEGAVGNDTGPMHLIAAIGCKAIVLYSHQSDPSLCGQRGRDVTILRPKDLFTLSTDDVFDALIR